MLVYCIRGRVKTPDTKDESGEEKKTKNVLKSFATHSEATVVVVSALQSYALTCIRVCPINRRARGTVGDAGVESI